MREHYTTTTNWAMYEKMDGAGPRMKKELAATIPGCPYEINLEIVITNDELHDMGFVNERGELAPEEVIAYELGFQQYEKEIDVQALLWKYIHTVKRVLASHPTDSWGVVEWDAHCPFLFECDPALADEEALQEERNTWV